MATLLELANIKHHAVRSDGAKFLDGVRNDSLNTSWLTVNSSGRVTLGPGLYDELLVVKGEVSDDQIKTWAALQAPFYDPAGNVVYEGAGADIEMDKFGIRATRKADNVETFRLDTETGDAFFKGDISGASGTFTGPIKSVDSAGNYSLLDEARLRFYRRIGDQDVLSYYVAQIATGQATDGEMVDLEAMGYRFFEPPKIILQPKLNRVFVANTTQQDVWMDWDILNQTFNPATGGVTFQVRCRTIIKGTTSLGNFSPSRLEQPNLSMTSITAPGTVNLNFRVSGYAHAQYIWEAAKLTFHIEYRTPGGSWTLLDTQTFSSATSLSFDKELSYNVPSSGASAYDVRIRLTELSTHIPAGETKVPHLTVHDFSYRSNDTVLSDPDNPEVISWLAIDGG